MEYHCPHCNRPVDIARRMNGDRVYCLCGKWYAVVMRLDGSVYLVKANMPEGLERR